MNVQALRNEIRDIEHRHASPTEACGEIFGFIRGVLQQINGAVEPEFKRALREELDRAHQRAGGAVKPPRAGV